MFVNNTQMIIYVMMIFLLLAMSANDIYDKTVSHVLTLGLTILGFMNAIIYFEWWNWAIFGTMTVVYIALFYILCYAKHEIGGADIKLMIISCLFLSDVSEFMPYLLSWSIISIIVFVYLIIKKRHNEGIAYVPILALALIITKSLTSIVNIWIAIVFIVLSIAILFLIKLYFSKQKNTVKECGNNEHKEVIEK